MRVRYRSAPNLGEAKCCNAKTKDPKTPMLLETVTRPDQPQQTSEHRLQSGHGDRDGANLMHDVTCQQTWSSTFTDAHMRKS